MRRAGSRRWAAALLVLVAAACTGGGVDETPPTATSTTVPDDDVAVDDGLDGLPTGWDGELRLGLAGAHSLDPSEGSPASISDAMLLDLLYDPLTELDETGVARPALATPSSNADATVWRFEIEPDATFTDGRAITADDVVASLNRVLEHPASYAAIQLDHVTSVSALGAGAVELQLDEPSDLLPELLSSPFFGIAPAEGLGVGDPSRPVASGDYSAVAVSESELELTRRAGTGPATIRLRLYGTDGEAFDAFLAGDVDWSPLPLGRYGEALERIGEAQLSPFDATVMLGVNARVPPLESDALRRAVALAVDRDTLAAAVFGPAAQPLSGLIPAGVLGASSTCVDPCGPDPAAARSLVTEAFPETSGVPLRILTDESETQQAIAGVLQEQLAAADITLQISSLEATTVDQLIAGGQQQLFLFSTLGLGRSPAVHLRSLFESGSPDNLLQFANADVDALIAAAVSEPLASARQERWRAVQSAVLAAVPVVPLVQLRTVAVVSPEIQGLVIRADGSVDVGDVSGPD